MDASELRSMAMEQEAMNPMDGQDNGELIGQLLNDEKVTLELSDFPLFALLTNSSKLSFLEELDRDRLMYLFEADVCKLGRINPGWFRDETNLIKLNQVRVLGELNLNRSVGTEKPNKKNERISITSERKEIVSGEMQKKGGVISKLFGI